MALFDYIEGFYNSHRRHPALEYLPPAEFVDDLSEIEMAMALEAAGEYLGPRYNTDEIVALIRHELPEDHRAR